MYEGNDSEYSGKQQQKSVNLAANVAIPLLFEIHSKSIAASWHIIENLIGQNEKGAKNLRNRDQGDIMNFEYRIKCWKMFNVN